MKIAVIGVGNVGGTLAKQWARVGHTLFLGVRNPESNETQKLANEIGSRASLCSPKEAAQKADVICLATPWPNTEVAIQSLGDLKGKIVIDCTNPLKSDLSGLMVGHESSGGELVQSWAQGASVVKCFNTVGFNIMADPILDGHKITMYYCGDNQSAKEAVRQLVIDVGFEPLDAGPLSFARVLEPYALLWITSAYKFGLGRDFAFAVVHRAGRTN